MNVHNRSELVRESQKLMKKLGIDKDDESIFLAQDSNLEVLKRSEAISLIGTLALLGRLSSKAKSDASQVLSNILKGDQPDLAWNAAIALGNLGGESATKILSGVASRKLGDEIRLAAVHGLGITGDKGAESILVELLANPSEPAQLRAEAAEALAFCGRGSRNTSAALMTALNDPHVQVRFFAAYALGVLGDPNAIPALKNRLDDEGSVPGYGSVGEEAAAALRQLQSQIE